jgi:hypothetical protein
MKDDVEGLYHCMSNDETLKQREREREKKRRENGDTYLRQRDER